MDRGGTRQISREVRRPGAATAAGFTKNPRGLVEPPRDPRKLMCSLKNDLREGGGWEFCPRVNL